MNGDYADLLSRLTVLPVETEWVEFKVDNDDPQEMGEQISALANSARLHNKDRAFLVWGVRDKTHEVVGTAFQPRTKKVGGQELENFLCTQLKPQIHFWIREVVLDDQRCVVFEIEPAPHRPVSFRGEEWIRVGSYTKPLRAHPEKEKALWRAFDRESFETAAAAYDLSASEVLDALNVRSYFELTQTPVPETTESALERFCEDRLLRRSDSGLYDVTNLGALLFSRDIEKFPGLSRKAVRVVFYKGVDRTETETEIEGRKGYASGFSGLTAFLMKKLPQSEEIRRSLRIPVAMYPEVAIRELIANALIHQDFEMSGTGPMVEVFRDRIEITKILLLGPKEFADMTKAERIRACYQHAALQWVSNQQMTNESLRKRFGFGEGQATQASRIISDTQTAGLIKQYDPTNTSKRHIRYIPFWA